MTDDHRDPAQLFANRERLHRAMDEIQACDGLTFDEGEKLLRAVKIIDEVRGRWAWLANRRRATGAAKESDG